MITGINESITLTKHIWCESKCNFYETKCKLNQWRNNNKSWCECKKHHISEKDYVWNPATCNCENGKYLASIINDSAIVCDEVIDSYDKESISINFNEKYLTCKTQNLYILLTFLLITIALLIAVSIYYYLIKNQAKQKHLLPFHYKKWKTNLYW